MPEKEVRVTKLHLKYTFPAKRRNRSFINKQKIQTNKKNRIVSLIISWRQGQELTGTCDEPAAVSTEAQGYSCHHARTWAPWDLLGILAWPSPVTASGYRSPLKSICHICQLCTVSQKPLEACMWTTESLVMCITPWGPWLSRLMLNFAI